jgi:hypothetical protein
MAFAWVVVLPDWVRLRLAAWGSGGQDFHQALNAGSFGCGACGKVSNGFAVNPSFSQRLELACFDRRGKEIAIVSGASNASHVGGDSHFVRFVDGHVSG